MSTLDTLENALLADIAAASDEQAIEAVRVAALGKKGSVSEMLKTLGSMSAEERQVKGPAINEPAAFGVLVEKAKVALEYLKNTTPNAFESAVA